MQDVISVQNVQFKKMPLAITMLYLSNTKMPLRSKEQKPHRINK